MTDLITKYVVLNPSQFDIDTNVMGYAKASSSIAIIGEDTGKDTIYQLEQLFSMNPL